MTPEPEETTAPVLSSSTAVNPAALVMTRLRLQWRSPTFVLGAIVLLSQVVMAASGLLIARGLGPQGRGVVTGVTAWPPTLAYLALFGMNTSVAVRVARQPTTQVGVALANGMVFVSIAGIALAAVSVFVLPPALAHLGSGAQRLSVIMLLTIPVAMATEVLSAVVLAKHQLGYIYAIRLITPVAIAFLAVVGSLNALLSPAVVVGATAVTGLAALGVAATPIPWRAWAFDRSAFSGDLWFGAKAHMASLLGLLNLRLDVLVISVFVDGASLGYYGMANNLMFPVTAFASAGAVLLTPKAAAAGTSEGPRAAMRAVSNAALWALLPAALAALGIAAVVPVAIPAFLGTAFLPTVTLTWILLPGYMARAYAAVAAAGVVGLGRSHIAFFAEGAALVVTACSLPFALPALGVVGAAAVSSSAYVTSACVIAALIARRQRMEDA